jgi:hypothetical protein
MFTFNCQQRSIDAYSILIICTSSIRGVRVYWLVTLRARSRGRGVRRYNSRTRLPEKKFFGVGEIRSADLESLLIGPAAQPGTLATR